MSGSVRFGQYLAKHPYVQAGVIFIPAFLCVAAAQDPHSIWVFCNTALLLFALSNPLIGAFDNRSKLYVVFSLILFAALGTGLMLFTQQKLQIDVFADVPKRMQVSLALVAFILVHIIVAVFRFLKKFMDAN